MQGVISYHCETGDKERLIQNRVSLVRGKRKGEESMIV